MTIFLTKERKNVRTKKQENKKTVLQFFSSSVLQFSVDHRGNVLLLTLLLLSFFLFIGLVWGTLVLRGLKSVAKTDEAIVAFAAAESGIEEALFRTRKSNPPIRFWAVLNEVSLSNGASWMQRSTDFVSEVIFDRVAAGETKTVNLYDPYYPSSAITPVVTNIASARVSWDTVSGVFATVQLKIMRWNVLTQALEQVGERLLSGGCQFVDELTPGNAYQLVLTPDALVAQLSIAELSADRGASLCTKHDGAGTIAIPNDLTIRSRGTFRSAQQAMEITFPRVAPW